ncbi:MAG: Dabb family protein [Tannerella sp.]|nr:Dabb family protein [Tannerella sp.]
MKRRNFIQCAGTAALAVTATSLLSSFTSLKELKEGEILHTVIFDLKHPEASPEANKFMTDARRILTAIPGVRNFQAYRQCSPKNDYQYGFLMTFNNQAEFDAYTAHPDHTAFVVERWDTEVSRFQESDFMKM